MDQAQSDPKPSASAPPRKARIKITRVPILLAADARAVLDDLEAAAGLGRSALLARALSGQDALAAVLEAMDALWDAYLQRRTELAEQPPMMAAVSEAQKATKNLW